jgi:hypothetical protein
MKIRLRNLADVDALVAAREAKPLFVPCIHKEYIDLLAWAAVMMISKHTFN